MKISRNQTGKSSIVDLKNGNIKYNELILNIPQFKLFINDLIIKSKDLLYNKLIFLGIYPIFLVSFSFSFSFNY